VQGFLTIVKKPCVKLDLDWKKALYAYGPLRYCAHGVNEESMLKTAARLLDQQPSGAILFTKVIIAIEVAI
jgi:hypothetical protein